jgi:uncharacterized protein (TIGR03067 family)
MRWLLVSVPVLALFSITGCSESRSPEAAAGAASVPREQRSLSVVDRDLDQLQGTWRIESSTWNGVEDPEIAKTVTILFQRDKFIVVDRDGIPQQETIKLIPDQNPKAIDCTSKGGGQPAPGIYTLEGDTFKWCSVGGANKTRPTQFSSQLGSKQSLMVLRRATWPKQPAPRLPSAGGSKARP